MPTNESTRLASRPGTAFRGFLFWSVAIVVFASPLPFGAYRPWAWSALALIVGVLLALWPFASSAPRKHQGIWPFIFVLSFAASLLWAALQTSALLPQAWQHPLWPLAAGALGETISGTVALSPLKAQDAILRLVAYAGVFWLAFDLGANPRRARQGFWLFVIVTTIYAAYGLLVQFTGTQSILWMEKWAYRSSVTATFVNRNSYATYAGMGLVVSLALLIERLQASWRSDLPPRHALLLLLDRIGPGGWFLLGAILIGATALLLSFSRAGSFAALIALAAVAILLKPRGGNHAPWLLGLALLMLSALALYFLSGDVLAERFDDGLKLFEPGFGRWSVFRLIAGAVAERGWLGIGLDGFSDFFAVTRNAEFGNNPLMFLRAHSTLLELLLELGVPAAFLLWLTPFSASLLCLRASHVGGEARALTTAGAGVALLLPLHGLVDFSAQIPAVVVTYLFLLGIATAQALGSGHRYRK